MLHRILTQLRVRPRLLAAALVGTGAAWLLPVGLQGAERMLVAWNIGAWLYLGLVWQFMHRREHGHLRERALSHADGALVVALLAVAASAASLVAIFAVIRGHGGEAGLELRHAGLSVLTLIGGWLLMTLEFALAYASRYYQHDEAGSGLVFPAPPAGASPPQYVDFVYFALTVSAAAQTSDVAITTRAMRRLVMMQAALSFAFNTTVLALAINIVAGAL